MRRLFWLLLAVPLLSPAALAADMPVKAPPRVAVPVTPWSGIYFGVIGGGAKTRGEFSFLNVPGSGDITPSGLLVGGLVGFGAFTASNTLFAVEVDGSYDFTKSDTTCVLVLNCEMKSSWFLTQRLVVGAPLGAITGSVPRAAPAAPSQWPVPLNVPNSLSAANIMPYLTAGIAERRLEACVTKVGCEQEWLVGWVAGGGIKVPIAQAFSMDLQYLYVGYNKHFIPAGGPMIFPTDFKTSNEQMLRIGLTGHL